MSEKMVLNINDLVQESGKEGYNPNTKIWCITDDGNIDVLTTAEELIELYNKHTSNINWSIIHMFEIQNINETNLADNVEERLITKTENKLTVEIDTQGVTINNKLYADIINKLMELTLVTKEIKYNNKTVFDSTNGFTNKEE